MCPIIYDRWFVGLNAIWDFGLGTKNKKPIYLPNKLFGIVGEFCLPIEYPI